MIVGATLDIGTRNDIRRNGRSYGRRSCRECPRVCWECKVGRVRDTDLMPDCCVQVRAIIVEVRVPGTQLGDINSKMIGYRQAAVIRGYLVGLA